MRNRLIAMAALAMGLAIAAPLLAHHGAASLDNGKSVILKGTVKEWLYSNPHCLLTLDVKGADGKTVEWVTETQAPAVMYPSGYRKNSFKVGDQVTVKITPVKSGLPVGHITAALTTDGTLLGDVNSLAQTGVTELK
jgi:hypothetical protein